MSKVTVIVDRDGEITAIGHGHISENSVKKTASNAIRGGLRALPGQYLHELEIPEDLAQVKNFKELSDKIRPHVKPRH